MEKREPRRIVVAVPVSSRETCDEFRNEVDEVVCAITPEHFQGAGLWYKDFSQTSDEEVQQLLKRATEQQQQHGVTRGSWANMSSGRSQVRGASPHAEAIDSLAGFKRFPTWMWRNADGLDDGVALEKGG